MRAKKEFSYIIEDIFAPQEVFRFIQKIIRLSDYEMYQTFNMGMDYAIYLPEKDVVRTQNIIRKNKFDSINAGYITKGPRQVVIKPVNITYSSASYKIK